MAAQATRAQARGGQRPDSCAWCGAAFPRGATLAPGGLRCGACGVTTTSPWPTDDELDAAYVGFYRPGSGRFSGPLDRLLKASRSRLATHLDSVAPAGPILDVGAGDGTLVGAARARGREAVGLERGGAAPELRNAAPSDLLREDGPRYAAVVFWHVLEHLRDPSQQLAAAARLLLPGGLLVVAVPNAASVQAQMFGERWLALDPPRHLTHLTPQALTSRLDDIGLTVTRRSQLRGGQVVFGWLHGLVASLPGRPDLYDAIRRPQARQRPLGPAARAGVLVAGVASAPLALAGTAFEVAARRSGTIYVEARAPR